jgi:hypothetical protein
MQVLLAYNRNFLVHSFGNFSSLIIERFVRGNKMRNLVQLHKVEKYLYIFGYRIDCLSAMFLDKLLYFLTFLGKCSAYAKRKSFQWFRFFWHLFEIIKILKSGHRIFLERHVCLLVPNQFFTLMNNSSHPSCS